MSDWAVGDLALYVDDSPNPKWPEWRALTRGAAYVVSSIDYDPTDPVPLGLLLAGVALRPGMTGFNPDRFRKIRPDEHEACEPEFVTLLKRKKVSA